MPGKHAPVSSKSFLISVGAAAGGAIGALALVIGVVLVAVNAGSHNGGNPSVVASGSRSPGTGRSSGVTPSPTGAVTLLPPQRTAIAILNGSGLPGMAKKMQSRAAAEGYPVLRVGNAPAARKSTVYYRADSRAAALEFRRRFPEFTVVARAPAGFATDVLLTVVVGADYPSPSPAPSVSRSATPHPSPS